MRPLNFALARHEYVSQLQLVTSSWADIVQRFAEPPAVASQRDAWTNKAISGDFYCLFCPSQFKPTDDPDAKRNKQLEYSRCNANVLGKDLLVLDIDNDTAKGRSTLSIDEAMRRFADYEFLLYTSYNHSNPEKGNADRFRIVFPLSAHCTKADWELRREQMKFLWPFADPASFVLSQPFYLPVVHPDRQADYQCHTHHGKWMDWSEIQAAAKPSRKVSGNQAPAVPDFDLTTHRITLRDGTQLTASDLFSQLQEGYQHRLPCFSPFRPDQKPDCFAYRLGPNLYIWDNTTAHATPLRIVSRRITDDELNSNIIIDWLAENEQRKAARKAQHQATLHTVPEPPKPAPLIECTEPSPIFRMESRYLDEVEKPKLPQKGMVFIKSPKGTGKTEFLKRVVQEIKGRVLLIGHRVSLLSSLSERLGLVNYQNTKGTPDRLAISLDSLTRLSGGFMSKEAPKPYDTVFIDESEQVLRHLTSDTLKKRRSEVINNLIRVVRGASRIICLDADLTGELSIEVMAKLRGDEQLESDELIGYLNEYQYTDRSVELFPTQAQLLTDLLELMVTGQRAFIATNVRAFAERLAVAIPQYWPDAKILVISSHTRDEPAVLSFLEAPSAGARKYDVVIATPSMATGVSIDTQGHFAAVYGFFTQRPATFQDCDQAISRVREALPVKVWIQGVEHKYPPRPERHYYDTAKYRETLTRIRLPNESTDFTQGELLWLDIYARLCWLEGCWMHNKRQSFIDLKQAAGYTVTFAGYDKEAQKLGEAALEQAKHDVLQAEVEAIMAAWDLDDDEAEAIAKKQVKTRSEELSLTRYHIQKHLRGQPFTEENVYTTLARRHLQKARRINQGLSTIDTLIRDDKNEREKSKHAVTDYSHRTKEVERFRELATVAGLEYRTLLADALKYSRARKKLDAAKRASLPRSGARRLATGAFNAETAGIDVTISKAQLLAIAAHYAKHVAEYNLFFGSRIKDPTKEENQLKAWNATFGFFGLPLRKLKKGPRGNQSIVYQIDYLTDGLLLEVMANAILSEK